MDFHKYVNDICMLVWKKKECRRAVERGKEEIFLDKNFKKFLNISIWDILKECSKNLTRYFSVFKEHLKTIFNELTNKCSFDHFNILLKNTIKHLITNLLRIA